MSAYLTSAQLKATLGITVTTWDADVTASITAASDAIDNLCQRGRNGFNIEGGTAGGGTVVSSRYYSPVTPGAIEIDDLSSATAAILISRDDGLDIDTNDGLANTWTLNTDFFFEPLNAPSGTAGVDAWPFERIRVHPTGAFLFNTFYPRSVKLTARFGWVAVPGAITDACTLLAERLFKMKREAPMGILAFQDVAVRVARADSNLMITLGPYMRHRYSVA